MKKVKKESLGDVTVPGRKIKMILPAAADADTIVTAPRDLPQGEPEKKPPVDLPGDINSTEDLEKVVDNKINSAEPTAEAFLDILGFIRMELMRLETPLRLSRDERKKEESRLRKKVFEKARGLKLLEELRKLQLMQENKQLGRWKKLAGILK